MFDYSVVQNDLKTIFQKWCNLYVVIGPVIDNMEEFFGKRAVLVENRFLNVMQALETFHRRMRPNQKISKEAHKIRINEILASIPLKHQEWLKERLNFSNEPSLHSRLEDLFNEINPFLKEHLFSDYERIILNSKNSRNYYTHYDKKMEKKSLKGADLHYLTQKLNIFLIILLLQETGFSKEKTTEIIESSSKFLYNHLIVK